MLLLTDFQKAYHRIRPHVRRTSETHHQSLDLYLKWESHQLTNSFKPRGALNKILSLPQDEVPEILITGSAGNHGQAVAMAAQIMGVRARVFVPEATPAIKVEHMLRLGAQVERVPGLYAAAEARAIAAAQAAGVPFISPYNDLQVIAGAGTIALEWLQQAPELERILVPVGGGGLICGIGLCAKAIKPDIEIIGVLSENSPYLYSQYYHGHMHQVSEKPTLTDGLAGAVEEGSVTIELLPKACDGIIQVSEAAIADAIAYLYHSLGEQVEGAGAVGVAAVRAGLVNTGERPTGSLISGGNIDADILERILAGSFN